MLFRYSILTITYLSSKNITQLQFMSVFGSESYHDDFLGDIPTQYELDRYTNKRDLSSDRKNGNTKTQTETDTLPI